MTTANRTTYHHGDLKSALIAAADSLICENGLEGFTLRAAARHAGVSPGAPAHHFGSIKGLLTEVALLGFERLGETLSNVAPCENIAERVRAFCLAYIRFALENPGHFRLMFRADLVDRDDPRYTPTSYAAMMDMATALMLYRGRTLDPAQKFEDTADLFSDIATVHGLAHLVLENKATIFFQSSDNEDFLTRLAPDVLAQRWP